MLNSFNSKQAVPSRISARATLSGFSQNSAYAPDRKATKFIVTLKPVKKNSESTSTSKETTCHCEGKIKHERGKLKVRADDAFQGKTILNAFRLLANSKFITIDPNYGSTTENISVGQTLQTINQIRLTGGSEVSSRPKKKISLIPACIRTKKKSKHTQHNATLFYDNITEESSSEKHSRHHVCTQDPNSEQDSSLNEIYKPRSFKNYSQEPSKRSSSGNRLGKLETQVEEMRQELSQIRKEFIPQNEVERYAELQERLKDLNLILYDLKNNCVKSTCSKEFQTEELHCVQYINPPQPSCVLSHTGTQTMQERFVEEMVLPVPRNGAGSEKICICDDCECKESGECLLRQEIEPNVCVVDIPVCPMAKPPPQPKPEPEPEPEPEEEPEVEPIRQTVDSFTEMSECSEGSLISEKKSKSKESVDISVDSSQNAIFCYGICGNPKCGKAASDDEVKKERPTKCPPKKIASVVSVSSSESETTEEPPVKSPSEVEREKEEEKEEEIRRCMEDCKKIASQNSLAQTKSKASLTQTKSKESTTTMESKKPNALKNFSSYCLYCNNQQIPIISENLHLEIYKLIQNYPTHNVALTILLQTDEIYHINISQLSTGANIGCIYATEEAIKAGNNDHLFDDFLTFFIVDSRNTLDQKNKILQHTFEFIRKGD